MSSCLILMAACSSEVRMLPDECSTAADCDDGNACTLHDCVYGSCRPLGEPASCDDGNPCTDDGCNPASGCVFEPNRAPCDDGEACTSDDTCTDGRCVGGTHTCDCRIDTDCETHEDGDLCNGTLVCEDNYCHVDPFTVVMCDASGDTACRLNICDPATGTCSPTALADSVPCDDGSACSTQDVCVQGVCMGTRVDCEDGNPCTNDSCIPESGCRYVNNTLSCDDGDLCTGQDTCAIGVCTGAPIDCDDSNPCTTDACVPDGECQHTFNTLACDDGNACTNGDVCEEGACAGTAIVCADDNPCTDDHCEAASGCVFTDNNTSCDDLDACTMNDACQAGACSGEPLDCSHLNGACRFGFCDPDSGTCRDELFDPEVPCVEAVYRPNGRKINDYVLNDGAGPTSASGAPCTGYEQGYTACLHAGEIRQVVVGWESSCADLSLEEENGWLEWTCDDSGVVPVFYSTGLREGIGLEELLEPGSFRLNRVTVLGSSQRQSDRAAWWNNPHLPLPDNGEAGAPVLALDQASAIYYLDAGRTSQGYVIEADSIGIAFLNGAVLTHGGSEELNCAAYSCHGEYDYHCLLRADSRSFLWMEAKLAAGIGEAASDFGLSVCGARFSRLQRIEASGGRLALAVYFSENNMVRSIRTSNSLNGISIDSDRSLIEDLESSNNGNNGIYIEGGSGSIVRRLRSYNNDYNGIVLGRIHDGLVDQVASFNNTRGILFHSDFNNSVLSRVTIANNDSYGIWMIAGHHSTLNQILSINNFTGLYIDSQSNYPTVSANTFSQVAAVDNRTGIELEWASENKFSGSILVGNTLVDCSAHGEFWTDAPGLVEGTCTSSGVDGSSDYPDPYLSDAEFRFGRTATDSIFGQLSTDDGVNVSDSDGFVSVPEDPTTIDWFGFENAFRGWGRDAAYPGSASRGQGVGQCRVWDWRLLKHDTVLLNRSRDGASPNEAFVPGQPCPAAVDGNSATTDQHEPEPNTYLYNAVEMVLDGVGDDDGLCESFETCLYLPNYGAYQGHTGPDSVSCVFQDEGGTTSVVGVTMLGYLENGV